jgi:iron(III) transport system ATP-binding protein
MERKTIRGEGLRKRFGAVAALAGADLEVARGEIVALLGPSGCGKTTLLRAIAGFERPDEGRIELEGRVVCGDGAWVPPEARRVGMVFQDYALFPHLTVAANVGFGLPRGERRRGPRVAELLALVELDGLGERYPHELSGGQQQRVAFARALAPSPQIVLLDEPWSNLDPQLRADLRREVSAVLRPLGVTAILVTHDREEAFSVADRVALMRDGAIVQAGTPEELYFSPATRWAAEFVGAGNLLPGTVDERGIETPLGRVPGDCAPGHVEVVVRPELVVLVPDAHGRGEVVGREFRGHDVFYRVRLDGLELVSQRPSNEAVPLGARVSVRLHEGPVAVLSPAEPAVM